MFLYEFTFMFLRQLKRLCLFTGPLHCSFVATECVRDGRAGGSLCASTNGPARPRPLQTDNHSRP